MARQYDADLIGQLSERLAGNPDWQYAFPRDEDDEPLLQVFNVNTGEEAFFTSAQKAHDFLTDKEVPEIGSGLEKSKANGENLPLPEKPKSYPKGFPFPPTKIDEYGNDKTDWGTLMTFYTQDRAIAKEQRDEQAEIEAERLRIEAERQEQTASLLEERRQERLASEAAAQQEQETLAGRISSEFASTGGLSFETADQAREAQFQTPGLDRFRLVQSPTGRFLLLPPIEEEEEEDPAPTDLEGLMTQAWNRGDMAAFNRLSQASTPQATQPTALDNLKLAQQFAQSGIDADTIQKFFNFINQAQGQQFGTPTGLENFGMGPTSTSAGRFGGTPGAGMATGQTTMPGQQQPFGAVSGVGQQQATAGVGKSEFQQWLDASRFREGGPPADMPTARKEFMERFAPTPTDMELYGDPDVRTNLAIATQGLSPEKAAEYERQYWIRQGEEGTGQFESVEGYAKRRAKELGVPSVQAGFTPGQQMAMAEYNVKKLRKESDTKKQAGIEGLIGMFPKKPKVKHTGANVAKIHQAGRSAGRRF